NAKGYTDERVLRVRFRARMVYPLADEIRFTELDRIGGERFLFVRFEAGDAETAVLLSRRRLGFYSQLLLFEKDGVLDVEIGDVFERFVLDRDLVNPVLLSRIGATV